MVTCLDPEPVEHESGFMRRHKRSLAALLLSLWLAPTLLFATAYLWFTARSSPGVVMAVSLALFWIALRVRRRRRRLYAPRVERAAELQAAPALRD